MREAQKQYFKTHSSEWLDKSKELQYAADTRKEIAYQDESTKEENFPILHDPWVDLEKQFI